jgi:hypothetical protein
MKKKKEAGLVMIDAIDLIIGKARACAIYAHAELARKLEKRAVTLSMH